MKSIVRHLGIWVVVLVALVCCDVLPARVWTAWAAPAEAGKPVPPLGMHYIAGGVYTPLFKEEGTAPLITVAPLYVDIHPVTHAQYVAFVQANPRWRRSQASPLLADTGYLHDWQADFPSPEVASAWVADFQTPVVTGTTRGDQESDRERFCGSGAFGVSGQERTNYPAFMRYAYRSSLRGTYTVHNLGFRCAKDLP